jgi:hypothetical protein
MSYEMRRTNDEADDSDEPKQSRPTRHLVPLSDGQWGLWRWVGLRATGFAAEDVLNLGAPECAALADDLLDAEARAQKARAKAIDALKHELKQAGVSSRNGIDKAVRQLEKKSVPEQIRTMSPSVAESVDAFRTARDCAEAARTIFDRSFASASARISKTIRAIAGDERFREAIAWQNRHALRGSVNALLRMSLEDNSRLAERKKREELIATYLQRYCTKNDTIGFFGPVGWARLDPSQQTIDVRPGPGLLETRNVYFEGWCIDKIAELLSEQRQILPWIAPRRAPFIHLEGRTLHVPMEAPLKLSAAQAALIQLCDGNHTAREIAQELIALYPDEIKSEAELYGLLEYMQIRSVILWTLEVPFGPHPEETLRNLLKRIGNEGLRSIYIGSLDELESARLEVGKAAGDAEKLNQALENLEETFTRLTGSASTRAAGQMYAGRTLVYEDCRRDLEVKLGHEIIESLGPPLSLLLNSARWLTYKAATEFQETLVKLYARLVRQTGSKTVDAITFWMEARDLLYNPDSEIMEKLQAAYNGRWRQILSIQPGQRRAAFSSEDLREKVLSLFEAPGPGWKSACYHSPDVMIAASSVDAIKRGEYELVLGEVHIALNTLGLSVFLEQHPSRAELFEAAEFDLPEPRIVAVDPKYGSSSTSRLHFALITPKDYRLEYALNSNKIAESEVLPIGSLLVEQTGEGLMVRTRDGRLRFNIIEVVADALRGLVCSNFKIAGSINHSPRINIGRLVVSRESWEWSADDLAFAYEKSQADRFLESRRWARAHDIPRFVFMKSPVEVKPVYVDLQSPIYVDILAKAVRRAKKEMAKKPIKISEMLPGLDQVWLPDAAGRHYTSEFRIVAVDLTA